MIPKQAQALAEEAERQHAVYLAQQQPQDPEPVKPEGAQPAAEPEAPDTPDTPQQLSQDDSTWEQRYRVLQGKYTAEVPRMAQEVRDLRAKLDVALAEIEKSKAAAAADSKPLVTDQDVETFGGDLIDVIDRKAREVAGRMVKDHVAALEAENQKLRNQLNGVAERQISNDRRAYFAELAQNVPDWEALNIDQGFMDWLAEVDRLSGVQRQAHLTSAWDTFDAKRTAEIFNEYKKLKSQLPQPAKQQLRKQVAPNVSMAAPSAVTDPASKIWSVEEIEQFYKDVRRGVLSRDAQVQMEAQIDQAVAEGRVRR